jgi:hypothetical protein
MENIDTLTELDERIDMYIDLIDYENYEIVCSDTLPVEERMQISHFFLNKLEKTSEYTIFIGEDQNPVSFDDILKKTVFGFNFKNNNLYFYLLEQKDFNIKNVIDEVVQ